jgi:hypothetical protein
MTLLILATARGPVMAIAELTITPTGKTTAQATYDIKRAWRIAGEAWLFNRPG